MSYPDDNPKTLVGAAKVPLHLVPPSATHYLAMAFKDGARKYGPYNWRDKKVSASVYVAAAKRHIDAWWDGENLSPDALVEHLAHVMACCAIILDAKSVGMLNDDRPTRGASGELQASFVQPLARTMAYGQGKSVDTSAERVQETPKSAHVFELVPLTAKQIYNIKLAADLLYNAGRVRSQHPMHAETLRERDASGV